MKVYKIRKKPEAEWNAGLFKKAGTWDWSKDGKIWTSARNLKLHLTQRSLKSDEEIIEYDLVETRVINKREDL